MTLTVYGDFNCPFSYLASQRMDRLLEGGQVVEWRAVEHDRKVPATGRRLGDDDMTEEVEQVRDLMVDGEQPPRSLTVLPNTAPAIAAYAESVNDVLCDVFRRAVFDAVWVREVNVSSVDEVKRLVAEVMSPSGSHHWHDWLGDPDPTDSSRHLGGTISLAGAPLSTTAAHRISEWRSEWERIGESTVPCLVDEDGTVSRGVEVLERLSKLLG